MGNSLNIERMLTKQEIVSSLEEMRTIARSNKRLFKINTNKIEGKIKVYGPVFSTAPKGVEYSKNKINLGIFDLNPSENDLDKREKVYISLGKSRAFPRESIYYSFDGDYFKDDEPNLPRPLKEVYGFLEQIANNYKNPRVVVSTLFGDLQKEFEKRFNEALEFEKESKNKK